MMNAVFFFGAGASAPFGIPTMQGMVKEFEKSEYLERAKKRVAQLDDKVKR